MHAGRPGGLAAEQAAVAAVVHQHDDRGVGAREMHGSATAVRAAALVAALLARGRRAADAAEAVARMSVGKAARVGQQGAVLAAHEIGRASCREGCVSTCRSRWSPYP